MAKTVREAIEELVRSSMDMLDTLLELPDEELDEGSEHVCALPRNDVRTLVANMIDHERIHAGQVADGRYESHIPQRPLARLAAEWFAERARFAGSLAGLTDEEFNAASKDGEWTYHEIFAHVVLVEHDVLRSIRQGAGARNAR